MVSILFHFRKAIEIQRRSASKDPNWNLGWFYRLIQIHSGIVFIRVHRSRMPPFEFSEHNNECWACIKGGKHRIPKKNSAPIVSQWMFPTFFVLLIPGSSVRSEKHYLHCDAKRVPPEQKSKYFQLHCSVQHFFWGTEKTKIILRINWIF